MNQHTDRWMGWKEGGLAGRQIDMQGASKIKGMMDILVDSLH